MANDITGNPIIVDTAGAGNIWPKPGNIRVHHFELFPSAANDAVTVKDRNGKIIWQAKSVSGDPIITQTPGWFEGLIVDALSAGAKLFVYLN